MDKNKIKSVVQSYLKVLDINLDYYNLETERFYTNEDNSFCYDGDYSYKKQESTSYNVKVAATSNLVNVRFIKRIVSNFRELPNSGKRCDVSQEERIGNLMLDNNNIVIIIGRKNQYGIEDESGMDTTISKNSTILDSEILSVNAIGVEDNFDLTNGITEIDYNEKTNAIYKKNWIR